MKKSDVPIEVTFRHLAPTDALRARAEKKLGPVIGRVPGATDAHIILTTSPHHHRQRVEVVVHGAHAKLSAHADTDDMYGAIDAVATKLESQVRTLRGRVVDEPRRASVAARRAEPSAPA